MSKPETFFCPKCRREVLSDQLDAHFNSKDHSIGLVQPPTPAQQAAVQQGPPTNLFEPQIPTKSWPYGNAPRFPPTRYLGWWDQVKGMWHYYQKGFVYWSLGIAILTAALLTFRW